MILRPASLLLLSFSFALGCAASDDAESEAPSPAEEDDITRSHVFACKDDRGRDVSATLTFGGRTLKGATLGKIPYRGFKAEQTFGTGEVSTGENSEQKFAYVRWNVPTDEGDLEASIEFLSKTKNGASWKTVSLDDALLGENHAVDGTPYGKLRVDVTIPWLDVEGAVGSTWFMYCEKK